MKRTAALTVLVLMLTGFAAAQVCVWVDSESPGSVMASQTGGSVSSITAAEAATIQALATKGLKADKANAVISPCPQSEEEAKRRGMTGDNIELDVVVGKFRGGYVASVSATIQDRKLKQPLHVSSNVIAASTIETLASDVVIAYESLKFRIQLGVVK